MTQSAKEFVRDLIHDDELEQHGVMGMRWGVRKDSSGRRVGTPVAGTKKAKRSTPSVQPSKRQASKSDDSPKESSKKNSSKPVSSSLSDQQLREHINRVKLEREFASLYKQPPTMLDAAKGMVKEAVRVSLQQGLNHAGTQLTKKVFTEALGKATNQDLSTKSDKKEKKS